MHVFTLLLVMSLLINYSYSFKVVWNIPDEMCIHVTGLNLTDDIVRYGFVRNSNNEFRGDKVSLAYTPGEFPRLVASPNGQLEPINGGVPQRGNLQEHLAVLQQIIHSQVPDKDFEGLLVLDMEYWRPILRQNFDSLNKYRIYSHMLVLEDHPEWITKPEKAERQFEKAARLFTRKTIDKVLETRRKSKVGYYDYPKCFNTAVPTSCQQDAINVNNNMAWLFGRNTAIFPSVYLIENMHKEQGRAEMVRTRVEEAVRVSKRNKSHALVYAYVSCRYTDTRNAVTKDDMRNSFVQSKEAGAEGVVLWGSSNELKTAEQCFWLKNYINDVLGPLALNVTDI